METIEEQVDEYRKEAEIDFISLGFIAGNVKFFLKASDLASVMADTMSVVSGLMARGLRAGDYTLESLAREGFSFWPGTPDEQLQRIRDEWTALNRMPDDDDICWFALKPSDKP